MERLANAEDAGKELCGLARRGDPRYSRKRRKVMVDPLAPTKEYIRNLDNMLRRTTSRGLAYCKPATVLRPLTRDERRVAVLPHQLPELAQARLHGRSVMSFIQSKLTDKFRVECCWGEKRQALWSFIDSGGPGFPSKQLLFYRWDLRGAVLPDPPHRRVRSFANALTACKLNLIKLEIELVITYLTGPHNSHANYTKWQEGAKEMFRVLDHQNPWFQTLYPYIVFFMSYGTLPRDFGSNANMKAVWLSLQSRPLVESMGFLHVRARWFSILSKFTAMFADLPFILMVMLYQGTVNKKLPNNATLYELRRLLGSSVDKPAPPTNLPAEERAGGASAAGADPPKSIAASNAALETIRRQVPDNFRLVVGILMNFATLRVMAGINELTDPVVKANEASITQMSTKGGCKEYVVENASGKFNKVIWEILNKFRNPAVLAKLGLYPSASALGTTTIQEDRLVTLALYRFAFELIGNELSHHSVYCSRPPYRYFQYLHCKDTERMKFNEWGKNLWCALERFEWHACHDAAVRDHWHALLWPRSTLCRELLVAHWECEHSRLPHDIAKE